MNLSTDFWDHVEVGDCWTWLGRRDRHGYGLWGQNLVHRLAYEALVGFIPLGLQMDHLCRNRACLNPDHLEPVTHRQNALRGYSFSGINAAKQECANGHPYTIENTYTRPHEPNSRRDCRQCIRDRVRRYKAAHQAGAA